MRILIFFILLTVTNLSYGQGCGIIGKKVDKETGVIYEGGIATSKDYYSLLIRRITDPNNPSDSLNYELLFTAASKYLFSDSVLNTPGQLEFILLNGESIKITNVQHLNNPLGFGSSIGFVVRTNQSKIDKLIENPAVKLVLTDLLHTEFNSKGQKQQRRIAECLKNSN